MEMLPEFPFTCQLVKDNRPMGVTGYKARATQNELIIGDDHIPYDAIAIAYQQDNRVGLVVACPDARGDENQRPLWIM